MLLWRAACQPQRPWTPGSVPGDGLAGGGRLCARLASWPAPGAVSPATLGRDLFPETGTFPLKACFFWCFRFRLTSLSWWGRGPANSYPGRGRQPPGPVSRLLCSAFWLEELFLIALGVSPRRCWDKEVSRAEKDARKPSLTKAIIKCYWKSYAVLGVFTLIEVEAFMGPCVVFLVWVGTEVGGTLGDRGK